MAPQAERPLRKPGDDGAQIRFRSAADRSRAEPKTDVAPFQSEWSDIRRRAKRAGVEYSFLFMRADGAQLGRITTLIEDGTIRPTVGRVFPFESLNEALAYIDTGRAKGKVVVTLK